MYKPHAARAAKLRSRAFLKATFVTLRRTAAICLLATVPGLALATTFTDTSGGGSFNVATSPLGGIAGCELVAGSHPYATRTLTTNNTTTYTFTVTGSTGFNGDPFLAVYLGTFDPANPTANLVACNDDLIPGINQRPQFEALLNADTTYTVVTTSYNTGVGGSATYNIGPDVTLAGAPLLSAVGVSGITTTSAVLQGTSSAAGTGYYVVQAAAEAAPSVAQVIAGQQSTGGAALSSGNGVMAAATSRTFNLAALQSGTAYTAYLVVRDNQSSPLSSVPAAANFNTVAIAPQAPIIGTATADNAQATIAFTAPADNGGSVITGYTVTSSPGNLTGTGSTSPITVTGLSNGTSYTFVVTATNAIGTGVASAASNAVVPVGPATLSDFGPFARTFGDAASAITAPTSPSSGAFTYVSSNPAVATISGDVVTVVSVGSTVITANQAADGSFTAGSTTANLVVAKANPTLSGFNDEARVFGDAPFTVTPPTSNSPGALTYTSSNTSVATVSGTTITVVGGGTTTLTAVQASTANYEAGNATAQLVVSGAAPTLGAFADVDATFGDAPITLVAPTTPSPGAFVYTSSNPEVATISGNVLTIVGSGTATLTATQAADGNYAGAQVTAQLRVDTLVPSLSGFGNLTATFGQASFELTAPTSPSAGGFTYSSSDPAVATINGNTVTVVGAGTSTIIATQAASGSYAGASTTAQLVVGAATPTITGFGDLHKLYGQAAFDLADPASNSTGAFTYTIDNAAVATINGRNVTLTGAGTATITATQAATANYTQASVTALLVVDSRPDPTQDAEVVSGLQAQMDTALRFADAQQGNVRDRLRQRRGTDAAGIANGLSINSTGGDSGISLKPELLESGTASKAWSFWTGGAISTGERKARGNNDGYDFHSDGLTIGADTRIGKDILLGLAVGGGWSDTDVGANGSTVDASQRALTVYGLWHASDSLFIDGQLAVGKLDYDLRRWSSIADTMGLAQRDGNQVFGSVTFGYESSNASRRLTSYGRIDAGRTTLDAYRETGLGIYDLDYREQTVEQRSLAVGLEGSHNVNVDWARDLRPYWQLEYRSDFSQRSDANINYVITPASDDYRLSLKPWASSNWNVGFGADFAFGNGVIVTALLRHELNVGMGSNTTVGLQFSLDFGGGNGANPGAQDAALQAPERVSKK